jgi:tRNA(Leu) C34 or U34 (ribose-2'-O)-methylase TrmL
MAASGRTESTRTSDTKPATRWSSAPRAAAFPCDWLDERLDRALRIPIRPEARSLNLANAVAITLFEAVRQIDAANPSIE